MQPYLFPYLGYFQLIGAVDAYVVYDDAQFIKGGWINRNSILLSGQPHRFSIALSHASPNKRIAEIDIADDFTRFLRTLEHAYRKAPMHEPVFELLRAICAHEDRNLARFAAHSLVRIRDYLGLSTRFVLSSQLEKDAAADAQDKVLQMCEQLGAGTYVNAIGGQSLYQAHAFAQKKISLRFLLGGNMPYTQFGQTFVPRLSIIDALMFNSPATLRALLSDYVLV